jgi:predicted ArsR family transcriptional regulator
MSAVSISSRRFLETTRGQIVGLLRKGAATVEELAQSLSLTDNAIRAHLTTLERDGLVRQVGVRRTAGAGKPATVYEIHPDAEPLFSRAYAPVLAALMDELAERLPAEGSDDLMRAVGRRLANVVGRAPAGDLGVRVDAAVELLNSLGGAAEVDRSEGKLVIRGCGGCPLSSATAQRPELCRALESLISEFVGAAVHERCDRGARPRCHFEIPTAA